MKEQREKKQNKNEKKEELMCEKGDDDQENANADQDEPKAAEQTDDLQVRNFNLNQKGCF